MSQGRLAKIRPVLVWLTFLAVLGLPILLAANSPLLAWRQPVYIAAGFAGVIGMCLLLVQPALAGGLLPGLPILRGRRIHRWTGLTLVLAVLLHVLGLWLTSPPDVIDALLFRSPTPFSLWGVLAMWALFAAALLAIFRERLRPRHWRLGHGSLVLIAVCGSILHALLVDGTMEMVSKALLCLAALLVTLRVMRRLKVWPRKGSRGTT